MPFVPDANPIECYENEWILFSCLQNDPASSTRIVDTSRWRHQPVAQWRPRWRRHIDLERRNLEINRIRSGSEKHYEQRGESQSAIRNPKSEIASPLHFPVP